MNIKQILQKGAALLIALALVIACVPAGAMSFARTDEAAETAEAEAEAVKTRETEMPTRRKPPLDWDFSWVRVLITIGSTNTIGLDLSTSYTLTGHSGTITGTATSPYPISVTRSGSTITVKNRNSGATLASGTDVYLERVEQDYELGLAKLVSCASSSTQDRMYLGNFRFTTIDGGLAMINIVPMAYYIFGIVGYELNPYCEDEALKAQAIAAKTFSMYFFDTEEGSRYDVKDGYSSSMYQAYRGYRENRISTMYHCLAVIGEALAFEDSFAPTCYGHSNGGETTLPSTVFGSSTAWYNAGYDIRFDEVEFRNYTDDTDTISITFGGTGDNSRFRDFILKKINALYGVSANQVKSISEAYFFDPLPGYQRHMQKLHVKAKVHTSSGDSTYTFECPAEHLRTYTVSDVDGSGDSYSSNSHVFGENRLIYWSENTSNGVKLYYSGHGHGIGMSQIGANIRANPATYGWTYRQILEFYYPGMRMVNITENEPTSASVGPNPPANPTPTAYGICTANGTNFRSGPGTEYSILGQVMANEHLDILDVTSNGWFKAVWNGRTGYITLDYSRITRFPAPANGVFMLMDGVTKNACNLRSEPYIRDGNVVTRLSGGVHVTAWTHINKWYYVTTENGYRGYLSNLVTEYSDPYEYTGVVTLAKRFPSFIPSAPDALPPELPGDGYKKVRYYE